MDDQEIRGRLEQLEKAVAALTDSVYGPRNVVEPMPLPTPAPAPATGPYGAVPYGSVPPGSVERDWVWTPQGRRFPPPKPEVGEMFPGYTMRVGRELGGLVHDQAVRTAGGLFGGSGQALLLKHSGNWVAAAEEHLFGNPNYRPDPAWGAYRPGV